MDASPLTVASAWNAIRRLLRELGIKPPGGRVGARTYEFRHAFAVHRLMAWANDGADIHAKLPLLSAYLGHNDLAHSLQYTRVLAIPSKKARQRPATYLEADDVRAIIAKPDRRTIDGWRDYTCCCSSTTAAPG